MTGRTHDLAAVTALAAAVIVVPPIHDLTLATALLALLANLIGGIAPDIDEPTAPFWRNLPIGGVVGRGVDHLLGGHRFLTHSLLGAALFSGGAWLLLEFLSPIMHGVNIQLVWYAFVIGLLSHLVMDTFTKEGVPWLLPLPIKFGLPPLRSLRITTGKAVEVLVVFPALLVADGYLAWSHYPAILDLLRHHIH